MRLTLTVSVTGPVPGRISPGANNFPPVAIFPLRSPGAPALHTKATPARAAGIRGVRAITLARLPLAACLTGDQRGDLERAAPGQGHAGAAVPVVVHQLWPAVQALGLQPDTGPHRPQPDPVLRDRRAAKQGLDGRAVVKDARRDGGVGPAAPGAGFPRSPEADHVPVRGGVGDGPGPP